MPSKKRKYNARFPAGRIKKIMQTDEEVGKVAQAVPIIISRTLEMFVESLLSKAMQVTMQRNAKTLSPSHVKQCILAESRFDFLRDLVKNVPDVTAAEEKEIQSGESSPNSSRFSEVSASRRVVRVDSNSSNSSDVKETLPDDTQHRSVIQVNPTYASPQPSTSSFAILSSVEMNKEIPQKDSFLIRQKTPPLTPVTPLAPIIKIDFTKNLTKPEIKVLDANVVKDKKPKQTRTKVKKIEVPKPVNIDHINSDMQLDEDYDT
ncbi:unnamed protein product [Leptosia nina]|uniref:Transcription factor CBF/NF-Y/archaeal histone domain-containing protein n=1 Tax=Leptosia nina TaxID=320188 RepID=A0AAV1JJK3_9NEOP